MATVTLWDEQTGAEASVQLAAGWLEETMPTVAPNPPEVSNGEVVLQIGGEGASGNWMQILPERGWEVQPWEAPQGCTR